MSNRPLGLSEHVCKYFVARTPYLSDDERSAWASELQANKPSLPDEELSAALTRDLETRRQHLRRLVARREIREAIFLASPRLEAAIDAWVAEPGTRSGAKVEAALFRYVARMSGRATPFGLFSGLSVGRVTRSTHLELPPQSAYTRHTRLDNGCLFEEARRLERLPEIRSRLVYRVNSSLQEIGGKIQYVVASGRSDSLAFEAAAITPHLAVVLESARDGASLATLAQDLVEFDSELEMDEAQEFVNELVDFQVLSATLVPCLTGGELAPGFLSEIEELGAHETARRLRRDLEILRTLDERPFGTEMELYARLSRGAGMASDDEGQFSGGSDESEASQRRPQGTVQVDMFKMSERFTIGEAAVHRIKADLETLLTVSPGPVDELKTFRAEFVERFGGATVPLARVLDPEAGFDSIFSSWRGDIDEPLLQGAPVRPQESAEHTMWEKRHSTMVQRLVELAREGRDEWVLDRNDLEALVVKPRLPMPNAFTVSGALCARSWVDVDEGRFRFALRSAAGPSSANLTGRFIHNSAELLDRVSEDFRAEESCQPDVIFAEMVHLPRERLANVIARPVLRGY
jgi:hypothetical protein